MSVTSDDIHRHTHTHTHTQIHAHTYTHTLSHMNIKRAMEMIDTMSITPDDFDVVTERGKHLGPTGEFSKNQFLDMMRGEMCTRTHSSNRTYSIVTEHSFWT